MAGKLEIGIELSLYWPNKEDTIEEGFAQNETISQEPRTVVNVTVEGNSFGNEEFTRQIVESIGEESGKQGLVFNNFQTA